MKAPPGYAKRLRESLGIGVLEEERVLHTFFVLYAEQTSRKHKKWEHHGLLVAKAQGFSILRFELKQQYKDGSYTPVFDEIASAQYFTAERVASLFKPEFEFCFADYDIRIVKEEENSVPQVAMASTVVADSGERIVINPPQVKGEEEIVIDQPPAQQDAEQDDDCVILSVTQKRKGRRILQANE